MLIVITRIRYSRWAVLAGISAVLCATNCLLLLTMDQGPAYRWINRNIANRDLAAGLLFTGAMGCAPLKSRLQQPGRSAAQAQCRPARKMDHSTRDTRRDSGDSVFGSGHGGLRMGQFVKKVLN
jgi:hypothetical protein